MSSCTANQPCLATALALCSRTSSSLCVVAFGAEAGPEVAADSGLNSSNSSCDSDSPYISIMIAALKHGAHLNMSANVLVAGVSIFVRRRSFAPQVLSLQYSAAVSNHISYLTMTTGALNNWLHNLEGPWYCLTGELQGQQLCSVRGSADMLYRETYNSRATVYAHPGHICRNSQYPWSPSGLQHQQ